MTRRWLACLLVLGGQATAGAADYVRHELNGQSLDLVTTEAEVSITAWHSNAFEVHYRQDGIRQLPSFAIGNPPTPVRTRLREERGRLRFSAGELTAVIDKSPFRIAFFNNDRPLLREESGFFSYETVRGFRFALAGDEKLIGAGQRVLGMDRRGHRLPLYNRAHYGYGTESEQMYYSLPAVFSSRKYLLVFDNSARGVIDLGKTEAEVLQFEAVGGRTAYLVVAGDSYPDLIENYVAVSGRQPLPPRWAFGNYASRFGYRTEREARAVVRKFRKLDIPLDAIVLDLYWFGPDIKGHMGNLDWDRKAFPTAEKMIADFHAQGVNTLLVTEPFILTTSNSWDEAVARGVLAKNPAGKPHRFDFYFGNTGLIDVFDETAADWFWQTYRRLFDQGVAGVWGDLGEPEVHPGNIIHAVGTGDEVHNAYGHQWAALIFTRQQRHYPDRRPFIMMRAGFAGSQRYGMIPWTGDVSRSWDGLAPQVELNLQMGLLGLAYTHSDLGGFAGAEVFDPELYIRWLQFGVFQPVYRPHAQDHIPPEPVFHDRRTRDLARRLIKLRYRLLPYHYTLAWENATTGMPLARPLFFEDETAPALMDNKSSFLWGDAFLVTPVTAPGVTEVTTAFPRGIWFDFQNGRRYRGGRSITTPVSPESLPVFVRAGSFIPMVEPVQTTARYSSENLTLHYYADPEVKTAAGHMYEDDGHTHRAHARGLFEQLSFRASHEDSRLTLWLHHDGPGYPGMPAQRRVRVVVHNWPRQPAEITAGKSALPEAAVEYDAGRKRLAFPLDWRHKPVRLTIQ